MSVATSTAIGLAAGVGALGSVGSAVIGSNAAGNAASTQSNAALTAAQIQANSASQALGFQQQQFNTNQNNLAPWLGAGTGALANIEYQLGINPQGSVPGTQNNTTQSVSSVSPDGSETFGAPQPNPTSLSSLVNPNLGAFGSLGQGFNQQFVAPTAATEQNDPGYQFRLAQGQKALEASAAAHGNLLSGGTAKAEQQFGQDYASNEYSNVYNRALGQYQQNYNIFQQNQANQFNRLAALSGVGQTTAGQLGSLGQQAATNSGNIAIQSGNAQAAGINNAAAATASGYIGGANAITGGLSGLSGNLGQLALLQGLLNPAGGSSSPGYFTGAPSLDPSVSSI